MAGKFWGSWFLVSRSVETASFHASMKFQRQNETKRGKEFHSFLFEKKKKNPTRTFSLEEMADSLLTVSNNYFSSLIKIISVVNFEFFEVLICV